MKQNNINFITREGYKIHRFPDGEVQLELVNIDRKYPVNITMRIKNSDDVFILMQLSDILNRQGVSVRSLTIPYLLCQRNDRVMDFNKSFNLNIISTVIKSLNACFINIIEPHNLTAVTNLLGKPDCNLYPIVRKSLEFKTYNTLCFPDEGAFDKYQYDIDSPYNIIKCKKIRKENGSISIDIVEGSEYIKDSMILVVDDLCDAGGTFVEVSKKLKEYIPVEIDICVTHAIQEKGIITMLNNFDNVYISNSYYDWKNVFDNDKLHIINIL